MRKNKTIKIIILSFCIINLVLHLTTTSILSQVSLEQSSIQDGPYVFWTENGAVVQYINKDITVSKRIYKGDKIKIPYSVDDFSKTYEIFAIPPVPSSDKFTEVQKIFAISDIHGKFDQMIKLLKGNDIVDGNLNWSWGNGHLVIAGDVFDRGDKMTEALWFIHQLEKEAKRYGGCVHFVLGNHEVMVLRGDLRYVNEKYTRFTAKKL